MLKTIAKQYPLEYKSFHDAKQRCYNPNNISYCNYGKRGIQVCNRWKNSFERFFEDMGPRPTPQHTLDRIDNNKGYSPRNCRWATRTEQAINRRLFRKSKTGVTGVSWKDSHKKYTAQIQVYGRKIYLGLFDDINDAIRARKDAEVKYWGPQYA